MIKSIIPQASISDMPQSNLSSRKMITHDTTILMELNHQRIPLTSEEKYRRIKYRKLNDLYLWYDSNIHKFFECLTTSKSDDSCYRESHSLSTYFNGFLLYSHLDSHLHIIIEVEVWIEKHWIKIFIMIDSDCSANMIDSRFAATFNIFSTLKSHAIKYTIIDNKINADDMIIHDIIMKLKIDSHQESLTLDIIKLHNYSIMLDISWLKLHDLWIQWSQHRIIFNSSFYLINYKLNDVYIAIMLFEYLNYVSSIMLLFASLIMIDKSILKSIHSEISHKSRESCKVS